MYEMTAQTGNNAEAADGDPHDPFAVSDVEEPFGEPAVTDGLMHAGCWTSWALAVAIAELACSGAAVVMERLLYNVHDTTWHITIIGAEYPNHWGGVAVGQCR